MPRFFLLIAASLIPFVARAESPASFEIKRILAAEVEVRSGPSAKYPITGMLRKGAQVYVRSKSTTGDFVAILPPPGSISWIPKAIVTPMGVAANGRQAFRVDGDQKDGPVPVHPGGIDISEGPLSVDTKYEVKRGVQGYIRGNAVKATWEARQWYPIDPLPGESRYLPLSAFQESQPSGEAIARNNSTSGKADVPARDVSELYRRAQRADQLGDVDEAIRLYQEVAREASPTNDNLANHCATRVYELRRTRRPVQGTLVGRNEARNGNSPPEPSLPGGTGLSGNVSSKQSIPVRSTGAGYLRKSGFSIDNRVSYALLDRGGLVTHYVTAEPGINLDPYVGRWVDLHGMIETRGDVRNAEYMRVVKVYLLR